MKKSLAVFVSILFVLSVMSLCFADEQTPNNPSGQTAVQTSDKSVNTEGSAASGSTESSNLEKLEKLDKQDETTGKPTVEQR